MKKFIAILFGIFIAISLCSCESENVPGENSAPTPDPSAPNSGVAAFDAPEKSTEPAEAPKEPTAFDKLFQYGPMAAKNEDGLWGYIDKSGEYVIDPVYSSVRNFGESGLAIVKEAGSGLFGVLDAAGNYVVEPKFVYASTGFHDGLLAVREPDAKAGYINEAGEYAIQPQFLDAKDFSEGYARVSMEAASDGSLLYRFINTDGDIISDPYFEAFDFSDGYALVNMGTISSGLYIYIDTTGNYIPESFASATSFNNGLAFGHALAAGPYDERTMLLNTDGNVLFTSTLFDLPTSTGHKAYWSHGLCPVKLSDGTGMVYINEQGDIVLPKSGSPYGGGNSFNHDGLALASDSQTRLTGYIDLDGNWVIEPQYTEASYFSNGFVTMRNTDVIRLFDTSGNCLLEYSLGLNEHPCGNMQRDPMTAVRDLGGDNKVYGYLNRDGSIVIDFMFEAARDFSQDGSYAVVQSGGLWGIIGKDGEWLIPPKFTQFMANGVFL